MSMTAAQILARFKLLANRPATDELLTDANIYLLLTDAQSRLNRELAVHCPWVNVTGGTMTTSDSGYTYILPSSGKAVGAVQVYPSDTATDPLIPGAYFEAGADYVWEGETTIRFTAKAQRATWGTNGPYARWVPETGTIDANTAPTLKPTAIHEVIVYEALLDYAAIGGLRDPEPWRKRRQELLWGDPAYPGAQGIIPSLKNQVTPGQTGGRSQWWHLFRSPVTL